VRSAGEITHWDDTADVVILGLGCAGACAALEARAAGADVLVLERETLGGGTSALSGGLIYLGGGTPVQKQCGFEDSPEAMFQYLMAACGPGADAAKIAPSASAASSTSTGWWPGASPSRRASIPRAEPSRQPTTD
jgi:3-oxo-5alpha-steroid 4-dehydrogenase